MDCDDEQYCTDDSCDPDSSGENYPCVHVPDHTKCDDGIACTDDVCDPASAEADPLTGCVNTDNCDSTKICDPDQGCIDPCPRFDSGTCADALGRLFNSCFKANVDFGYCQDSARDSELFPDSPGLTYYIYTTGSFCKVHVQPETALCPNGWADDLTYEGSGDIETTGTSRECYKCDHATTPSTCSFVGSGVCVDTEGGWYDKCISDDGISEEECKQNTDELGGYGYELYRTFYTDPLTCYIVLPPGAGDVCPDGFWFAPFQGDIKATGEIAGTINGADCYKCIA